MHAWEEPIPLLPNALPEDQAAWRFIKTWHRHPLLADTLAWRGMNLGELFEYHLVGDIMEVFAACGDRHVP